MEGLLARRSQALIQALGCAQVFKLMRPHYRYTLHINTNARAILINAGGVLEQTFTTGRYTMEIASLVYGRIWRFDNASFEKDLIGRWAPACFSWPWPTAA